MIDKSKKHSYHYYKDTQVVKYFDKYDFSESANTISDIKYNDSPYSFTKAELLAASILASEFNSSYVKTSGAFDIVEGDFVKTGFSNKDVLIGILTKYPKLITDKERNHATVILDFLDNEFAFKILAENLTDFEQSIATFLSDNPSNFLSVIGVAAYIPTYYDNNTKIATTATGVSVTGNIVYSGSSLTVEDTLTDQATVAWNAWFNITCPASDVTSISPT